MAAAVDGGDVEGIGEAVERQRARERNHVAAIDQPVAEPALLGAEQIEMDARRVLIEPGRDHMLGFFDGDAVDMIDALADLIIAVAILAAGQRHVVAGTSIGGQASPKTFGSSTVGKRGT